ncbi:LOW QUALITY PROTEIN: RNA polymerase, sigma-24 subunit, ECF subfamily [Ruminiclostridium papyrosolvens DSM 2782]|uniref:RNA polymerase, sigma-24 subunit, ECF subfamily n=1 Tax=Ruminiclostridium papyrosolvens DSM 2782 TaxID=588581 RepID=F1TBB5_9FIRM|nr:LOW QUALITY PROTEIN: RNA polymerase, sigma-24 subunit, ECF subfamily [Ruminiclostridium papyrosolvens DSM 2782]
MDKKILDLLKNKPEKGLEKLIDTYSGLVYTIIYNKLSQCFSIEDIEECVSSVFYEVYQNRSVIELKKGTLKAYIAVLSKRRAIDLFRKNRKHVTNLVSLETQDLEDYTAEDEMDAETKDMLIRAIKALGEPDSEIFIRKYYLGQNSKEISGLMGIKQNTIDKRLSRGLSKLRTIVGNMEKPQEMEGK